MYRAAGCSQLHSDASSCLLSFLLLPSFLNLPSKLCASPVNIG